MRSNTTPALKPHEKDPTLVRYLKIIQNNVNDAGMSIKSVASDSTLYYIKGGRWPLAFSIKPVKMVSVWQINDEITSRLGVDLSPYQLRKIDLRLNRRITLDLTKIDNEAIVLINQIVTLNTLSNK